MFTFKKHPRPTGLASISYRPGFDIKIKRKKVGYCEALGVGSSPWTIRFAVKDSEEFCGWRWIRLKHQPTCEEEARTFLKERYKAVIHMYDLHHFED